jgi:hypothetical protein
VVCCINGVMDTLIVVDRMVKINQPIFKAERGLFENTLWALYLVGPVAEVRRDFSDAGYKIIICIILPVAEVRRDFIGAGLLKQ